MIRILYVEDDPIASGIATIIFKQFGDLDITHVETGTAAFETYQPNKFDLLLFDISLPDVSGDMVLKMLHKEYGELPPVAALSAHLQSDKLDIPHADRVFLKPLSAETAQQILSLAR